MIACVKLSVSFAAKLAYCFFGAGCFSAGVVGNYLFAIITDMVFIRVFVIGDDLFAIVANMIFIRVCVIGEYLFATVANMVFIRIICLLYTSPSPRDA
mgnify:CR=1 FL=1